MLFTHSYTNISVLETDGPYGGYPCSSEKHSHHEGAADSVYWQNKLVAKHEMSPRNEMNFCRLQGQFYEMLTARRIYLNQPDNYFYHGGSKTGEIR